MTLPSSAPIRGDVWILDFDPTRGREQAGMRPALILSVDLFNSGPAGLVIVCPVTSKNRSIRSHVSVLPPEGGLKMESYIMVEHIRSVTKDRLVRPLGTVSVNVLESVEERIRILLDV